MRRGSAPQVLRTGDVYEGDLLNGLPHGKGRLTQDRCEYEGQFENGVKQGRGVMQWANGDMYDGSWYKGMWDGDGVLVRAAGTTPFRYVGKFATNAMHGIGKITFSDGTEYEGRFEDNTIAGKGKLTFPSGDRYVGSFSQGRAHGMGQLYSGKYKSTFSGHFKGGVFVVQLCAVDNKPCEPASQGEMEHEEAGGQGGGVPYCGKCRKPLLLGARLVAPSIPAQDSRLGIQVGDVDGYVRVLQVSNGSRGARHDLRRGDFIYQVGSSRVVSSEHLASLLAKIPCPVMTIAHCSQDGASVEQPQVVMFS